MYRKDSFRHPPDLAYHILFLMEKGPHPQALAPRFFWLGLFGIAMGLLEAVVVAYLRELYFPGGFRFPLQVMPQRTLGLEVLREISTIVMLTAVAAASARTFVPRFSAFLFTFGVWDICYYAFLKVLLNWPESLLAWDVLFLIPVTWIGPVLAPVLCSLTMIGVGLLCALLHNRYGSVCFGRRTWLLLGAGAALIFLAFIRDYASIAVREGFFRETALRAVASYVPVKFQWGLFLTGEALVLAAGALVYRTTTTRSDDEG